MFGRGFSIGRVAVGALSRQTWTLRTAVCVYENVVYSDTPDAVCLFPLMSGVLPISFRIGTAFSAWDLYKHIP